MRQSIRQELMQDLLMTNVYLDDSNKYISKDDIAYTYNNRDYRQFQVVINKNKLNDFSNRLYYSDYNSNPKVFKTIEDATNALLELLVTHEIGHIHNLHIFANYPELVNKIKECLLKNKLSFDDLSILGNPARVINIAEDFQVNSDYVSQSLIEYANIAGMSPLVSGINLLPEYCDYIIRYNEAVEGYFQELANVIKAIKEKCKGMNPSLKNDINNALNSNKTLTDTEKNKDIENSNLSSKEKAEIIRELIKDKYDNIKEESKKEEFKKRVEEDIEEIKKNSKNASVYVKDDSINEDTEKSYSEGYSDSNSTIDLDSYKQSEDKKITLFLKKILTCYSKKEFKKDRLKYQIRGIIPSNSKLIRTSYKTEYKKNIAKCLFILDVSGSMDTKSIRKALFNLKLEFYKKFNKIDIVFYDSSELKRIKLKELKDDTQIPRGNSTDMLKAIIDNQKQYGTIVVYSDFQTSLSRRKEIKCSNLYSIVAEDNAVPECYSDSSFEEYKKMNKDILYVNS